MRSYAVFLIESGSHDSSLCNLAVIGYSFYALFPLSITIID